MISSKTERNQELTLEVMLVLVTAAISCLLYHTEAMKIVVLNLFYLPIVLAGFFLGRYRAGVLALLAVVTATIVICMDFSGFGTMNSPVAIGLAVTLWGSVLGLTALLVGTLCDDRDARRVEAHEAHVGVVEVLSRYLQSANPALETRSKRVAALSEQVAKKMRLSAREIDDIRVAALLMDMENIEITARVIRKAVGALEDDSSVGKQRTFHGTELVQSLGTVLTGAFPLLLNTSEEAAAAEGHSLPFGARIIRTVRAYETMESDPWQHGDRSPESFIIELQTGIDCEHHPAVLHALRQAVTGHEATQAASGSTS